MKKLVLILSFVAALFCTSSCQKAGLFVNPTSVTIKVGQSFTGFSYGCNGEGIDVKDIKKINQDESIAEWDGFQTIRAIGVGKTAVGIVVYNDPDDVSKGFKYQAWCQVTVIN